MIIGLLGWIGSGKGTVGDLLRDKYGFKQDSFAAPLKDAAAAIFGWPRPLLEGDTEASREWREQIDEFWSQAFGKPITPRLMLQQLGTEACRDGIHPDIWTASLIKRTYSAFGISSKPINTVVTDCRFPNEIEAIHKEGGLVVHVLRGPLPAWWEIAKAANHANAKNDPVTQADLDAIDALKALNLHPSETAWVGSPIDAILLNDGTLADLRDTVDTFIQDCDRQYQQLP